MGWPAAACAAWCCLSGWLTILRPPAGRLAAAEGRGARICLPGLTPGGWRGTTPETSAAEATRAVVGSARGDARAGAMTSSAFFGCAREPAFEFRCAFLKGGASVGGARAAFAEAGEPGGAVEVSCALPAALVAGDVVTVELRYAAPAGDVDGGAGDGGAATETDGERALVADFPTVAVVAAGS